MINVEMFESRPLLVSVYKKMINNIWSIITRAVTVDAIVDRSILFYQLPIFIVEILFFYALSLYYIDIIYIDEFIIWSCNQSIKILSPTL